MIGTPPPWTEPGGFDPRTVSLLELDCYGDPLIHEEELRRLFHPGRSFLYLGHDLLLPRRGFQRSDGDDRVVLSRDGELAVRALANVCTHALRPLVDHAEAVTSACLTCPFHAWSFRRDGTFVGGPALDLGTAAEDEELRQRLALPAFDVLTWHGAHFASPADQRSEHVADLGRLADAFAQRDLLGWLDFADWQLVGSTDERYDGDWKTFMEVYGDCYHVPTYHPGLGSFADCATLEWSFGESFHAQFLRLSASEGAKSPRYRRWISGLRQYYAARGEELPDLAVAWTAIYPNVMIECYNGLRVISVLLPRGPHAYENRVHYAVPADMEALVPGLAARIVDAYEETAAQDRVLNESRHHGVVAARSLDLDLPPYTVNLAGPAPEAGTAHFHQWWRTHMK